MSVRREPRRELRRIQGAGEDSRALAQLALSVAAFAALLYALAQTPFWEGLLRTLLPHIPASRSVLFTRASLWQLTLQHLHIVGWATLCIVAIGLPLAAFVTRPQGRALMPLVSSLLAVGQTVPPVAVLALALPAFGFGLLPTLIALVAYGLLPVTRNAIAGLEGVPPTLREAATGMGMTAWQRLFRLELPYAVPVIFAGLRTSVTYTIATATVAPLIGAGGLGTAIIAGLTTGNTAYVLEGAIPVALLALLTDYMLSRIEKVLTPRGLR